jgi:uncharacterized protein YcfJ
MSAGFTEKNMSLVRNAMRTVMAVTSLGVASAALAAPPAYWSPPRSGTTYTSAPAPAPYEDGYEYADVVRAEPIVRQVKVETPRRECWDETQTVTGNPHISDPAVGGRTLLGSIIGGVIGHQFGSGSGRDAATIAGAAIGAGVGYDSARRVYGTQTGQVVQRCQVRYDNQYEERIDGYRVTYEYGGRQYTTRMPYDPGSKMRVRVAVAPAE